MNQKASLTGRHKSNPEFVLCKFIFKIAIMIFHNDVKGISRNLTETLKGAVEVTNLTGFNVQLAFSTSRCLCCKAAISF